MSKKKILFINPGESRHGSTYRARGLCQVLRDLRYEVIYAESNYASGSDGISISQRDSIFGYLIATFRRCHLCFKIDYDVLYLQKAWPLNLGCLIIAKLRKKKVFIDFDDLDSEWQTTFFRTLFMRFTEKWMPRFADLVSTHNQYLYNHISRLRARRVLLFPQGVDTELFDPAKFDKLAEKKRLGLEHKRVLCFLGSFTIGSASDLHVIFEALRELEKKSENVYFLMIGGGGPLEHFYLNLIKKLGLKNVAVTGRLPQDQVPRYLAACDLGLIFMKENRANRMRMSLKLLEYLAMGLTPVGCVTGESRAIFNQYGVVCEPSAHSLALKIIEISDPSHTPKYMRDFIVNNYDWRAIGNSVQPALGRAIG